VLTKRVCTIIIVFIIIVTMRIYNDKLATCFTVAGFKWGTTLNDYQSVGIF
jgi:hypothetical protein